MRAFKNQPGADDELLPHIGTSIGGRNPRRSYLLDLPKLYPAEFPPNFDPAQHDDEENTRLAYNAYLKKYLRCVKGIDDNLDRLFRHLEDTGQLDNTVARRSFNPEPQATAISTTRSPAGRLTPSRRRRRSRRRGLLPIV